MAPHSPNNKHLCNICGQTFARRFLVPAALVRNSIADLIKAKHPNWDDKGYICYTDLRSFRSDLIKKFLEEEKGEISRLDQEVIESLNEHSILTEDISKKFEKSFTFGERLADHIARFGGSWTFIIFFGTILFSWMGVNSFLLIRNPFDPYPYIFLNLVLSCLAAIQAPVIMMSQNRQAERDKLRDIDDYCTNLKAELEIRHLNSKLDFFMNKQWDRMLEIQQIQIELAEELLEKKRPKNQS